MPAETHMEQDPLGREAILQLIKDRLGEILEIDPNSVNEGDSFADDLDADSLALIELVEAIEEELAERSVPDWVKLDKSNGLGDIIAKPETDDMEIGIQTRLIIEYYSRR